MIIFEPMNHEGVNIDTLLVFIDFDALLIAIHTVNMSNNLRDKLSIYKIYKY